MFWISLASALCAVACLIAGFDETNAYRGCADFALAVLWVAVASLAGPREEERPQLHLYYLPDDLFEDEAA